MNYFSDYHEMMKLENLFEYLEHKSSEYENSFVVQEYKDGQVLSHTYKELLSDVRAFSNYLIENNIHKQHVSIIGNFSYEWLASYFSLLCSNNVVVPIDGNQSNERIHKQLVSAEVEAIIAEQKIDFGGKSIIYFEDIGNIVASDKLEFTKKPYSAATLDSTAMIMFSSGTTGESKLVPLTHKNILHGVISTIMHWGENTLPRKSNTIALLPPYHMFGIFVGTLNVIYYGVAICYSKNTKKDIEALIKTFKPSILIVVPQVVEGLHKKIWAAARKTNKQDTLKKALKLSSALRKIRIDLRKVLFKSILDSLGGNLFKIVCGGANSNVMVIKEMTEFGIEVMTGYGLTECAVGISINLPKKQKWDSVGLPMPEPFCSIKIKDGEIQVSGTTVMNGYFNDPQGTEDIFDDIWLKTGDLGWIDKDGYLYITGRKKNLIILNDGNNISPEELEIRISQSPIVDSVLVYSKKRMQTPVVLASIYPDFQYCSTNNISDIKGEAMKLIHQINAENPHYMKIFDIEIRDTPFEKTAIGKINRSTLKNLE